MVSSVRLIRRLVRLVVEENSRQCGVGGNQVSDGSDKRRGWRRTPDMAECGGVGGRLGYTCDACGADFTEDFGDTEPFCPDCGAEGDDIRKRETGDVDEGSAEDKAQEEFLAKRRAERDVSGRKPAPAGSDTKWYEKQPGAKLKSGQRWWDKKKV